MPPARRPLGYTLATSICHNLPGFPMLPAMRLMPPQVHLLRSAGFVAAAAQAPTGNTAKENMGMGIMGCFTLQVGLSRSILSLLDE